MIFTIQEVQIAEQRAEISSAILRALPDWFGIEESTEAYVRQVQSLPFWAAFDGAAPIGFVALKPHTPYAAEVCVMGVLQPYHRAGVGRQLIERCAAYCTAHAVPYLTVKTLDESSPNEDYAKTRKFYLAMGFRPIEVFPLIWDEHNPCLLMLKPVAAKT